MTIALRIKLDIVQNEAAGIALAATKLPTTKLVWNLRNVDDEIILFHKMMHNLTFLYLPSFVPQTISNLFRYNLRNYNDIHTLAIRKNRDRKTTISSKLYCAQNVSFTRP